MSRSAATALRCLMLAALVGGASLAILGCGSGGSTFVTLTEKTVAADPVPSTPLRTPAENAPASVRALPRPVRPGPRPDHEWSAIGRTVASRQVANGSVGRVEQRSWAFATLCKHGHCRTIFARSTLYGDSLTLLVRHGRYWTGDFPPVHAPCSHSLGEPEVPGLPGRDRDDYKLWWSRDGSELFSISHQVDRGCGGGSGGSTYVWSATRRPAAAVPAKPGQPAS